MLNYKMDYSEFYYFFVCDLPINNASVHYFQDDDPFSTVLQKFCHFVFQVRFSFVFGHYFKVVPRCFAFSLQLNKVFRQLLKIHLWEKRGGSDKL